KTYGIEDLQDKTKLVFLGRLTPDKGWGFTMRSLTDWATDPNNAHLVDKVAIIIAGDGELRTQILEKLQPLAIATGFSIHLLGRIAPNAVPALLTNCDIHITASEKETLGLTVLEAFAAGIPAIAPAKGGVTTHIRDGKNGLLFEPQDSKSFGQLLTRLVSDVELQHQLGQQGQRDVADYDWENVVSTLLSTWQNQISSHSLS
ncbi:MAG: glycosyltransferase, partial [Phormidesmis sp.]